MPTPFGDFIRTRRTQLGLTQRQVAQSVGVTPECITLIEAGRRQPELERVPRLADALQTDRQALCRLALECRAPVFYYELVGTPGFDLLTLIEDDEGADHQRVLIELDRDDAEWVRQVRLLDCQTRHHLREIAERLAPPPVSAR